MASQFPNLFTPVAVGRTTVRNRLVMLPMGARLAADGRVGERERAWSEERAAGGIGLMITGGAIVHPTSGARGNPIWGTEGWREDGLPGQTRRVEAVHRHGAKIFGQFLHVGRDVGTGMPGTLVEGRVLAPSPIRSAGTENVPHQMDRADIAEIVEAFALTASLMQRAGFDGLEIHGAHNYLIGQFLSPWSNQRTDSYGSATIDTRMRFLLDVVEGVRDRVGPDIAVGVRLSATEEIPGGITLDDTLAFAEHLQACGLIDYLSVTVGIRGAYVKDNSVAPGVAVPHAAALKRAVDLPILVGGRITTPDLAERIVADGLADLVGMGRALIADPQLPARALAGDAGRIRRCVGFVQDCRQSQGGVTCAINASAGRELQWSGISAARTTSPRRLVIAGGGPAGMEAARVAAQLGHAVVLYEQETQLGGQLLRAARGPLRADLGEFARYLADELERLDVDVRLGTRADAAAILADRPDMVLIATGSVPAPLPVDAGDAAIPVLTSWDVLDGTRRELGQRVLVVDDGTGFWEVCSAAECLVAAGLQITFATPNPAIGRSIPHESLPLLHRRLRGAGAEYLPFTALVSVRAGRAELEDLITGGRRELAVDGVVVKVPNVAVDGLRAQLGSLPVHLIGDSVAPRRLTHAVLDANTVVRALA